MKNKSGRILIVDDDRDNGTFLQDALSQDNCRAVWYADPRKALRQFQKSRFQVGILDLKMPHMGGLELFQRVREKDPDIGLIILTGYPSVDTALATLKKGAYDYVKKPFRLDDLKKVVHRLLEEKGVFLHHNVKINECIGTRVKEFRTKRGKTIAEVAGQTSLSKSLISQIENGKNSASLSSLSRISRALKVPLSDLVQDL